MVLVSNVTAAVRANTLPSTVAPVVTVMEAKARMFPLNTEPVPRVAELPTCQKTLAALAPPLKITWRPVVVVSVEAIWKKIGRASCRGRVQVWAAPGAADAEGAR